MPSMTSQRAAKGWTLAHRLQTHIIGRQLVQWFPITVCWLQLFVCKTKHIQLSNLYLLHHTNTTST